MVEFEIIVRNHPSGWVNVFTIGLGNDNTEHVIFFAGNIKRRERSVPRVQNFSMLRM